MNNFDFETIEQKIGIVFSDKNILQTCFTHVSYANEFHLKSNENLEFLGDSILGFVVAEYLFERFDKKLDEGDMSKIRSRVVCTESLLQVSKKLNIAEHLLAVNQKTDEDMYNQRQYANLVEAIIAAIYLDKDFSAAKEFILTVFEEKLKTEISHNAAESDYKTRLQEIIQKTKNSKIEYIFINRSGEDHDPHFVYSVEIDGDEFGKGEGRTKREAQMNAAKQAIEKIKKRGTKFEVN
ncbi:MAG: ribonuclease III [Clostridia bacterium]